MNTDLHRFGSGRDNMPGAGTVLALAALVMGLLAALVLLTTQPGCKTTDIYWVTNIINGVTNIWQTNAPPPGPTNLPPVVTPTNTPSTNTPQPAALSINGCMFTLAKPGEPANHGVTSQLDYRGIHGQAGEDARRLQMFQDVKDDGGNVLTTIRGGWCKGNVVLDMCLNGRKHPQDGHYFPTGGNSERDYQLIASQQYGLIYRLEWIWNDDGSMPVNEQTVIDAVASFDGTRIGISNVLLGVCLEANEGMSAAQGAQACKWILARAPACRCLIGSASTDYLKAVAGQVPAGVLLWVEQDGNPVAGRRGAGSGKRPRIDTDLHGLGNMGQRRALGAPLTRAAFAAFLEKCNNLAAAVPGGKARVVPGEFWLAVPADRQWAVAQLRAAGYGMLGNGKYN